MLKKMLWGILVIFLVITGYIIFWEIPVKVLPVLPDKYAEKVVNHRVESFLKREAFPDDLVDVLHKHPEVITPNMYDAIAKMYVMSQDGQTKDMQSLILKVNSNALFCYIIQDLHTLSNNQPTAYTGETVAEAIGQPWQCEN